MENSEGSQATPPVEPPQNSEKVRSDLKRLVDLAENSKALKFLLAVAKVLYGEWEGLKKCWLAVVIILLLTGYTTYWVTAKIKDYGSGKLSDNLQTAQAKLQQSEKDYDKLQKISDENTAKYNEQLREKDVEISRISSERDSLQGRVTMLQAMPDRMTETTSNAIQMVNAGITNWQQNLAVVDSIRSLTNDLASLKEAPLFTIRVNGMILSNCEIMPFPTDGTISISVENVGTTTADGTCITFSATVDETNLISDGWYVQPKGTIYGRPSQARLWTAERPIQTSIPTDYLTYNAASLHLNTNANYQEVYCILDVYAKNAKTQKYLFAMCVSNQVERATAWLRSTQK